MPLHKVSITLSITVDDDVYPVPVDGNLTEEIEEEVTAALEIDGVEIVEITVD